MITDKDVSEYIKEPFASIKSPELIAYDASLEFSASVAKILKDQDMTLKQLADLLGVKPPTLSEKLNGKTNLTLKSMAEIASVLDCDLTSPVLKSRDDS